MSYEDEEIKGGRGPRLDGDESEEEEPLEPLEDGALNDFRFDEDADDDPESRYS